MKKNKIKYSVCRAFYLAFLISALSVFVPFSVLAEEAETEEGAASEEGGEEAGSEGAAEAGTVPAGQIETNIEGKYLAVTFPENELPMGFTKTSVDYAGTSVDIAELQTKSSTIGLQGLTVTIAYLTDADGSNGEFYLCDTTDNAKMSDLIKIDGADGRYIIILDPGDNVVGPVGFTKRSLQWGGKSAVAWSLPNGNSSKNKSGSEKTEEAEETEESEAPGEEESDSLSSLFSVKAYAFGLPSAGSGSMGGDDEGGTQSSVPGDLSSLPAAAVESAMQELDSIAHTNASGLIQAQPKEFCLLYATDESGNLGFYLYDITGRTYQRYVDIDKGESDTLMKYRKLSRTRLLIIVVLIIVLVIMLFILINTKLAVGKRHSLKGGDDDRDEMDVMRERVAKKEKMGLRRPPKSLEPKSEEIEEERDVRVSPRKRPQIGISNQGRDDREAAAPQKRVSRDMDARRENPRIEKRRLSEDVPAYPEEDEHDSIVKRQPVRPTIPRTGPEKADMSRERVQPRQRNVPAERNKDREKVDWENMEITSGLPKKETENALNNGGRDGNAPDRRPRVRSAEVNPPQADRPRTQPRREPQARREPLARPQQKNRSKDYDFDDDFDFEFIDV
ncbi:MAG: hypothetical protein J6P05_06655 [Lachnospiraceae bacterium]|nr:hypothetical protein [Lachnospiraceae bacterium]